MDKLKQAGTIQPLRNSIYANTRTMLQSFANETRNQIYEENEDIFGDKDAYKYEWLSTLDSRTCIVCGSLDGTLYKTQKEAPQPPIHRGCRCLLIFHFDIEGDTRASKDGQKKAGVSFEEWLKEQDAETQKEVLGATRYKMFKDGVNINQFVDNGKILTLDELNQRLDSTNRNMANGQRRSIFADLSDEEIQFVKQEAKSIQIPESMLVFRKGRRTCYNDIDDKVYIGSDVMPSDDGSTHNRDTMSVRAVLAHEYYGHQVFRNTKIPIGDWKDEFRASYHASVFAPNLSDKDRMQLMRDALDRASEAGVKIIVTDTIRRILYGR